MIHISTTSVSGNSFDNDSDFPATVFDESKFYIGQSLENVYIRSKFEAEKAVLEAIINGLDAIIIRVGNLANRTSDLLFQKNYKENATLSRLKAFADLGFYPRRLSLLPIEVSPVNDTAKGIINIAQHYNMVSIIFHLYNDKTVRFDSFVKAFKKFGIKMKAVSTKRFREEVNKIINDPSKSYIFETFVNDLDKDGNLRFLNNISLNNNYSTRHLNYIGFDWSRINSAYMKKYAEYFRDIGYFGGDKNGL